MAQPAGRLLQEKKIYRMVFRWMNVRIAKLSRHKLQRPQLSRASTMLTLKIYRRYCGPFESLWLEFAGGKCQTVHKEFFFINWKFYF